MKITSEEKVYKILSSMSRKHTEGVITIEVANEMNISRNTASHYLNRLYEIGLVIKTDTKPVYWKPVVQSKSPKLHTDAFSSFIGFGGSCRHAIEQCKAAVNYPPNGLPIIINGPSGVGKSVLARLIYKYAVETGTVISNAPFITLNCADYANNPQLLTGILFGYKKGAFTGADTDHTGMIQEANNGYLFLDEVHRLSFENQEKLFILMDQGKYRPLGDSKNWLTANVRLIFATTENLEEALLETFRRRIPVRVELTPFASRPLQEKLEIISKFYHQESFSIKKDIFVDPMVVGYLCYAKIEGNIGMLHNMIKLSCAGAFNRQSGESELKITAEHLPVNNFYVENKRIELFDSGLFINKEMSAGIGCLSLANIGCFDSVNVFLSHVSTFEGAQELQDLQQEFQCISLAVEEQDLLAGFESGVGFIYKNLFHEVCYDVFNQYGIQVTKEESKRIFLWYLYCKEQSDDIPHNLESFNRSIQRKYPRTCYVIQRLLERIKYALPQDYMRQDIFRVILLFIINSWIDESYNLQGLIVAHGTSTASSIASVANNLCQSFIYEAFDMPVQTSVNEIIEKVNDYINIIDTRHGLILLVDMGSLAQMYSSIKNNLKGNLLIINNLTTSMAMDIGFMIKQKQNFTKIVDKAKSGYFSETQYYEGIASGKNVIISCISGLGIAIKLKEIVDAYVDQQILEIIAIDYATIQEAIDRGESCFFKNTQLIITTSELMTSKIVPILNLPNLWNNGGEELLWQGLECGMNRKHFEKLKSELLKFFSIEGVSDRLNFLNPKVIINEVENVLDQYERYYHIKMESFKRLNLYLHISAMIERLMVGDKNLQKQMNPIKVTHKMQEFFDISQRIFNSIVQKYNICLNQNELTLLYELINS